jgi:hypothetical protein
MTADALILAAGAALVYAWLCATVAPIAFAINSLITTRGEGRAWITLAVAAGSGLLWTTIAAGALLLGIAILPGAGLALLLSPFTIPGMSLGVMTWGLETVVTARLPRVGPAFELATALALLSFASDESRAVAEVERVYGAFLIDEMPVDSLDSLGAGPSTHRRSRRSAASGVTA